MVCRSSFRKKQPPKWPQKQLKQLPKTLPLKNMTSIPCGTPKLAPKLPQRATTSQLLASRWLQLALDDLGWPKTTPGRPNACQDSLEIPQDGPRWPRWPHRFRGPGLPKMGSRRHSESGSILSLFFIRFGLVFETNLGPEAEPRGVHNRISK